MAKHRSSETSRLQRSWLEDSSVIGIARRALACHHRGVLLVWLIAGIALVVAELLTVTFVLVMFAAGAFAAAGVAALGVGAGGQALVFAGVSTLALVVVRPGIQRYLHRHGERTLMGIDAIQGATALVLETVDAEQGLIKIDGELWRARPYDASQTIPEGARVRVIQVDGATALVWKD